MDRASTTTRWMTTPLLIVAVLAQSCAAMSVGVCGCGDMSGQNSQSCCCDQQARDSGRGCCSSRSESVSVESVEHSCCQQSQERCSKEQAVEKTAECHCGCSDQMPAPLAPTPVPQSSFNWDALLCACFAAHIEETDLTLLERTVITESNLLSEPASSLQVLFCVWLT